MTNPIASFVKLDSALEFVKRNLSERRELILEERPVALPREYEYHIFDPAKGIPAVEGKIILWQSDF